MLVTGLITRAFGQTSPFSLAQDQTTRLLQAIQPAPHVCFEGHEPKASARAAPQHEHGENAIAHTAGTNAIVIDKFEGRYLLSGAADGEVSIWDLEASSPSDGSNSIGNRRSQITRNRAPRSAATHTHGITALSYYPFDSLAFTSSSYDHTLKLWDSTTLQVSASFEPSGTPVYAHAISPIASHLLVACGTQHPAIRLVDLHTGATTHTLAGHTGGAVLSVAWSPKNEHVLASGGMDGTIRLWDVRRSAGCLGVLDAEDGVGVLGYDGLGDGARPRFRGTAHAGPVNGLVWTEDGRHLVSTGHDEKIHVWDCHSGANTFATFGPIVRNRAVSGVVPLIAPKHLTRPGEDVLFYPSEKEIVMFELFEGRVIKKLKAPGLVTTSKSSTGDRNIRERVTALAWRTHTVEMFSAHGDGTIRAWQPRTSEDAFVEEEMDLLHNDSVSSEIGDRKRKRQVLDDIEHDLTKPRVTFS